MLPPQRIVCLTEETVETLYLLGEDARIVGVSGFAQRPPQVRREKPRVSAFTSADIDGIAALTPDLVLTYSDLQADIAAQLIRRGIAVHAFTHHDLAGIFSMIRMLGAIVGAGEKADALARDYEQHLAAAAMSAGEVRPRVFFEEWSEPIIAGSRWVSELIEIAGGTDVFSDKSRHQAAKERFVSAEEVVAAAPDIIIGSWCGKQFKPDQVKARPGFGAVPAVKTGKLYEINSTLILQPGPAALTDGLDALRAIIAGVETAEV